jgi:serine-type D-Ala-D-Ala carboxypeptidase/endopeptidase
MLKLSKVHALSLSGLLAMSAGAVAEPLDPSSSATVETIMEHWRLDAHVPGLAYGIVWNGQLIEVKGLGVLDVTTKRPVDADSLFRIASMSKAFTALAVLKLRDEGKISLDALAETYVPELRGWRYPTRDSRRIRVRDLLNHTAGFVTDDPWGDRHQPYSEAEFTKLLKVGVPFSRQPGIAMEYSNFGYATLGRLITNVSGKPYQDYIRDNIMVPLGMSSTGYDIFQSPLERRAIGYRWQDNAWSREPDMADGTFGAMGGVQTSAKDYARWVAFLLSAWPPRDDADAGPVPRGTVREIVEGSNFPTTGMRAPEIGGAACRQARTYAMGWYVIDDCDLGRMLSHGGGYPGYGSRVLLFPDKGLGIFVLTNKTYSGPVTPATKAALALISSKGFANRTMPVSKGVAQGYEVAKSIWAAGSVAGAKGGLSMNFLMDRDEAHWATTLSGLKAQVGACTASEPVVATTAMQATFVWICEHGRIQGSLLLAPEDSVQLQSLEFSVAQP